MKCPTRTRCIEFLNKYGISESGEFSNIMRHTLQVNKVSVFIAKKLNESGEAVNIDLVDRASLLHDVCKVMEIKAKKPGIWHAAEAYNMLKQDYPEVAQVIKVHIVGETGYCKTWEEKIVNYADKRVAHDKIVTLEDRFKDLMSRYGSHGGDIIETIRENEKVSLKIEKEIFSKIKESPDVVLSL